MTKGDLSRWSAEAAKLISKTPAKSLPIVRAYLEGATAMAKALSRVDETHADQPKKEQR